MNISDKVEFVVPHCCAKEGGAIAFDIAMVIDGIIRELQKLGVYLRYQVPEERVTYGINGYGFGVLLRNDVGKTRVFEIYGSTQQDDFDIAPYKQRILDALRLSEQS